MIKVLYMNIKLFTVFYYTYTFNVAFVNLAKFCVSDMTLWCEVCMQKCPECDPQHRSSSPVLDGSGGLLRKFVMQGYHKLNFGTSPLKLWVSEMLFVSFIRSMFAYIWNISSISKLIQYGIFLCFCILNFYCWLQRGWHCSLWCMVAWLQLLHIQIESLGWVCDFIGLWTCFVVVHQRIHPFWEFLYTCYFIVEMTHLWGITDLYPVRIASSVVGWMLSSHHNIFHRKLSLFMLCLCCNL
jgi:hypothetical protein